MVPEVDGSNNKVLPMMTTTDMSLKIDPDYNKICKKFLKTLRSLKMHLLKHGLNSSIEIWGEK